MDKLRKCPQCGLPVADNAEYCVQGHKQNEHGILEMLEEIFNGKSDNGSGSGRRGSSPR